MGDPLNNPDLTVRVADAEIKNLEKLQRFFGNFTNKKLAGDILGPAFNIPSRVASFGDLILGQIGFEEHDDVRQEFRETADKLAHSPLEGQGWFEELNTPPTQAGFAVPLPPAILPPAPPRPVVTAPAAGLSPAAKQLLGSARFIVIGALRSGLTGALQAEGGEGVLLGRIGTVGRVFPTSATLSTEPVAAGDARRLLVGAAGAVARGSFHPLLVEPVNDAGIRNADAQKGIGKELVHERADP